VVFFDAHRRGSGSGPAYCFTNFYSFLEFDTVQFDTKEM
jgi:hypothetical protein